ncbi:ATP-dependent metalloprotease [compost metagenome]
MTNALMEWETIDADQVNDIMAGKPPRPPRSASGPNGGGSTPPGGSPVAPTNAPATA